VIVGVAVAGAVFGIASAVQASIPDANGVIHACYAKAGTPSQGDLRVTDSGICKPTENPLDWNQVGPTGQRGPTGPTGPGGVTGIGRATYVGLTAGEYVSTINCTGFGVGEGLWGQASVSTAYTQRDSYNNGEAATGTPDATYVMHFSLSATTNFALYGSCADPSVFGLSKPKGAVAPPAINLTKVG
jgi:hypothetical protein